MLSKEKALYQAKLILDYLPEEEYELIPEETIDYIENNFEYDENIVINPEISLENQDIRDNINSAGYSSSIFTHNGQNANDFLKLTRTKNVFVNASPTLERKLDICLNDMTYEKNVMAERI